LTKDSAKKKHTQKGARRKFNIYGPFFLKLAGSSRRIVQMCTKETDTTEVVGSKPGHSNALIGKTEVVPFKTAPNRLFSQPVRE
jgi:hypothetical protein